MDPEESYKILVEVARHQTDRLGQFNNINMAVHALIVTAMGYKVSINTWPSRENYWQVCILSLFGLILAFLWYIGIRRMRNEVDMRYAQLRALERKMKVGPIQQIFTEGFRFFHGNGVRVRELRKISLDREGMGFISIYKWLVYILMPVYIFVGIFPLVIFFYLQYWLGFILVLIIIIEVILLLFGDYRYADKSPLEISPFLRKIVGYIKK